MYAKETSMGVKGNFRLPKQHRSRYRIGQSRGGSVGWLNCQPSPCTLVWEGQIYRGWRVRIDMCAGAWGIPSVAFAGDSAFPALNLLLIPEDLCMLQILVWVLKSTLDFRNHTNLVIGPLKPLRNWYVQSWGRCSTLGVGVRRGNECVCA